MKRVKEMLGKVLGVMLLVLAAYASQQQLPAESSPAATSTTAPVATPATSAVQMVDYNKNLAPTTRDDNYRTTYEIFVYSFRDSNGDGVGDLNGIRESLDYIKGMGFDQLWLTPVHPSATYHKYDVDDYYAIDPAFGTMEDYEALLADCHARGIRVLMDLVLNHTSDTHPWFVAATDYLRALPPDQDPVFEDCPYVWYYTFSREQYDGFVPLEGTPWYYEARFWSEMPDLNLGNEVVRDEVRNLVRFWLDKGVDGFRLDAVTSYVTGNPEANVEFLRFLTQACKEVDPNCYLVGEAWTDRASIATLYASGIDSLFDFPFADSGGIIRLTLNGSYTATDYVRAMTLAEEAYRGANPAYVDAPFYTNHDMGRSAGYYAQDDGPLTKMSYAMSLLMPGNSFVYYGEELGMKGSGKDENKRAPMYWTADAAAQGMCAGPPDMEAVQMKFAPLDEQTADDLSIWRWFVEVIRVRRAFPAIARGETTAMDSLCDEGVAAFVRHCEGEQDVLLVMNLRDTAAERDLSTLDGAWQLSAVLNTDTQPITLDGANLTLPAYSIAVLTPAA
jgi:glycosidase